jgi:hypothetical protein
MDHAKQLSLRIRDVIVGIDALRRCTVYRIVRVHRGSMYNDEHKFLVRLGEEVEGNCGPDIYTFIPAKYGHMYSAEVIDALKNRRGHYYMMCIWAMSGVPDSAVLTFWRKEDK